jgi:tRNA threonylcarbamoyladenosine biosynthesis protein TsaE
MATNICARLRAGILTTSAAETQALAEELATALPPDCTLALHGNLGVGKTTFVQGLARGFGITEPITSPTFAIYSVYQGRYQLVHLDAYRIKSPRELDDLLIEDFLTSPWCLAVEWPEKVAAWLPADTWRLDLGIKADDRHTLRLR